MSEGAGQRAAPEGQLDLWYVATRDVGDAETLAACRALLTDEEREKHAAFLFDRHKHEYLVTRGLARGVLAQYAKCAPRELSFVRNEYGRPALVDPSRVRFNLTNTTALVVCGVIDDAEIGVDAEPLSRAEDILELADTVFTPHERELLAAAERGRRRRKAVALWTLKEAYIKARGMGMSLPVERVELELDAEDGVERIRFHPPVEDRPGRWRFSTLEVEGHLVSTCVEAPRAVRVRAERADLGVLLGVHHRSGR